MTTIPNPLTRILELADPADVDQPAPPAKVRSWSSEIVPVTEPCEKCGCQWIADPSVMLPEGHAECCFCRTWRGSIHRDTTLSEYTDRDDEESTANSETFKAQNASSIPVYDPEKANIDAEGETGVVAFIERGGE